MADKSDSSTSIDVRKLSCDICSDSRLTEVTSMEDGGRAILLPDGWRLIWSKKVTFRCNKCWHNVPTGQFKVGTSVKRN